MAGNQGLGVNIVADGEVAWLDGADLAALPRVEVWRRPTACSGLDDDQGRHYQGARLRDVLVSLGMDQMAHEDLRRCVLLARADDGYCCSLSLSEILNNASGDAIVLADTCNGAPLPEASGPLVLLSASDHDTALRFVKRLRSIEFRLL